MKETEEEGEATLAHNNPWVLNYAHQHNKEQQQQKNPTPPQNQPT